MELLDEGALRLALGPFAVQVELEYQRPDAPEAGAWTAPPPGGGAGGGDRRTDRTFALLPLQGGGGRYRAEAEGVKAALAFGDLQAAGLTALRYRLSFSAPFPTRLRLRCRLPAEVDLFHLVPAVLHGDNGLWRGEPGHYPNLTRRYPQSPSCSPLWELRADRSSHPVSILCSRRGAVGISIVPYSEAASRGGGEAARGPGREGPRSGQDGFIRNGLFAGLPDSFGVTLGYRNTPWTFVAKKDFRAPTQHLSRCAEAEGGIYASPGPGRTAAHGIIRTLYGELREAPRCKLETADYLAAFLDAFRELNWSPELGSFTNRRCQVPDSPELVPWRPVLEIGWTGGGCILYPLLLAQDLLGGLDAADPFTRLLLRQIRRMGRRWNPRSGLLLDLSRRWRGSQVNGWWAGYLVKDVHCAYTNGSAVFYLLASLDVLERRGIRADSATEKNLMRVLDTVIDLQREDGCLGATFAVDERKVVDWDGFAGCWLAAALARGYLHSRRGEYLASAERALGYYHRSVKELACHGTPMDTMKAVDEEGNLAFIRASRLLHQITAKDRYLEMLQDGCDYECLWKYAFRARPEFPPLLGSSWSSCGGSVTSVSNPHIHPMGVTVADDLRYLHGVTGDEYHGRRAEDTLAWAKNSADLYPQVSGYGRLGVLTERFCPSDGLLLERFGPRSNPFSLDCLAGGAAVPTSPAVPRASTESSGAEEEQGSPASIWFSYHAWAAAAVLEGLCHALAPFLIPLPW